MIMDGVAEEEGCRISCLTLSGGVSSVCGCSQRKNGAEKQPRYQMEAQMKSFKLDHSKHTCSYVIHTSFKCL